MGSVLKIFLIFIAIYFLIRMLFKWLVPFALRKFANQLMKKAQQQGNSFGSNGGAFYYEFKENKRQNPSYSETEKVQVDYIPPQEAARKGTETAGEFVDFEEIK